MGSKKQRSPRPPCCLPSCTTNGRGSWSVYTLPSSSSSFRRCFFLVFLGVLCCLCLVSLLLIGEEVTCLSPSGVQRHHNPASSSSIPPHRRSRGKHFISLIQEKTQTHPVGADGRRLAGEESKTTQEGELSQHGIRGTGKDNIDLAHKVPVAFVHWEAQSHLQPISSHIQIFETPALEPPPPSTGETKTPPITPVASSIPLSPPSVTPTPPVSSPSPLPIPAAAPPSNGAAVGAAQPSTAAPTVSPSLPLQPQGGAIGGGGGIPPSSPAVVVPQSPGIVVKTEETPHLNQGMAGVGVSPVPGIVAGPSASPPDAVVSATAPSTSQGSPISGAPSLGVSPNPLMVTLLPEGSPAATPIVSATPSVPPQPAGNAGVGALTGGSPSLSPLAVSGTVPGASGSPAPAASSPALTPGQGETTANNPGAVSPGTSSSPSTNTSPSSDASQASTTGGSPPSSSTSPTGPSASGGVTTPSQEGQAAPASGATGGAPSGPPAPSTEGAGENAGTLPLSPSPSETAPSPGLAQAALGNGAVLSGLSKNVGELILRPDGTHAIVGGDLLRAHHDKNVAEIEARLQEAEAERDLAAPPF
ncbi:hypothetical protein CSUI_002952 [Cystoisospora suis]|uniref:Transmembrane protein n=1 Tax=Cystoisospora suis TaxID=483139 RepID=A0A2C6L710_9APIC|nr:hypothetical protein CSUI_002952 [Cystoisospora suis]